MLDSTAAQSEREVIGWRRRRTRSAPASRAVIPAGSGTVAIEFISALGLATAAARLAPCWSKALSNNV
jgi:anti-sigma factor RsiW